MAVADPSKLTSVGQARICGLGQCATNLCEEEAFLWPFPPLHTNAIGTQYSIFPCSGSLYGSVNCWPLLRMFIVAGAGSDLSHVLSFSHMFWQFDGFTLCHYQYGVVVWWFTQFALCLVSSSRLMTLSLSWDGRCAGPVLLLFYQPLMHHQPFSTSFHSFYFLM